MALASGRPRKPLPEFSPNWGGQYLSERVVPDKAPEDRFGYEGDLAALDETQ